ncbi:MAG TPA: hypothetical protein PLD47_05420 [Aggregatilineales bacterium]|nr:hypothetical protein [Anaerolineales bacterium]HRE47145.1 hypothetical protein [Aggregatilineales bacterium]
MTDESFPPIPDAPELPDRDRFAPLETADTVDSFEGSADTLTTADTPLDEENAPGRIYVMAGGEEGLRSTPVADLPRPSDADAVGDLARAPRATAYRAQRRTQISMIPTALTLLVVGILGVIDAFEPGRIGGTFIASVAAGGTGLALVGRFLLNGRRESGLSVLGLSLLAWVAFLALLANGTLSVSGVFAYSLMAIGGAIGITFLLGRTNERGLILPALGFIVAGAAALPILSGLIPTELLTVLSTYWSLFLLGAALLLLPLAIRPRP